MIQGNSYSTPQLCSKGKYWFVYFDIKNLQTGQIKRVQSRRGLNFFLNPKKRLIEGKKLVRFWEEQLRRGWMPEEWTLSNSLVFPTTPFTNAWDFAFENCEVGPETKKAYRITYRFVKAAIYKLRYDMMPVMDVEKPHIMLILKTIRQQRNWSPEAYNKHLGYLCAIMERLVEWKAFKYNPAKGIKHEKVVEKRKYISFTKEEKSVIQKYLHANHYLFYVYLMVLYHTGIRPKEILSLKVSDVNLKDSEIIIYPDQQRGNSKTGKIRRVPINHHLKSLLLTLDYSNPEYYLFGSPCNKGEGRRGKIIATDSDYFKPSATMIKRDTVTKLWNAIVIKKLEINKHLYAAKHTGADDKIMAGIDLDALRDIYGHSSKLMTEKYVSVLKEVYKEKLINGSPAFV
jgi:integrase